MGYWKVYLLPQHLVFSALFFSGSLRPADNSAEDDFDTSPNWSNQTSKHTIDHVNWPKRHPNTETLFTPLQLSSQEINSFISCRERSVIEHTHKQACTQTPTPQSIGNDPFESRSPHDSEDKDACRMNQLEQDGYRPPAQETTTDTQSPGREPGAEPHHTAWAPAVSPRTALFSCSIVVFLVVAVLMFLCRIIFPFLSLSVLFVFLCVFYFGMICVCPCVSF